MWSTWEEKLGFVIKQAELQKGYNMHWKARLKKKLKMVGCRSIDVELYKNFYAKLGVQIWATLAASSRNTIDN